MGSIIQKIIDMKKFYFLLITMFAFNVGNAQWTALSSGTTNNLCSVFFTNANNGYAVGMNGTIVKTIDGGTTWSTLSSGTTNILYSVFLTDANTGYAVGELGTILKTTNGGTTWTALSSGTWNSLISVFFTDINTGYVAGEIGTILKTTNGGTNWSALSSGTANNLASVYFTDTDTGYAVGDHGTILKTTNGGGYVGINNLNQNASTLTVYPNPTSNTITIETLAKGPIFILNLGGQQLLQQEITEPTTAIDVSGLPSGVYVVKVVGEKGVQVGKFIKQ
jgi:photosystem II stability/assembly factor-like uncharacterized protein